MLGWAIAELCKGLDLEYQWAGRQVCVSDMLGSAQHLKFFLQQTGRPGNVFSPIQRHDHIWHRS